MKLIGLAGPKGCGKSTISKLIANSLRAEGHKVIIQSFAKPLKDLATSIGWDGQKDEKGRRLLQILGTEVCRKCIRDDYWIAKFTEFCASEALSHSPCEPELIIICDDVRFDNEAALFDKVIQIKGRNEPWSWCLPRFLRRLFNHASECGVERSDLIIDNSKGYIELEAQIYELKL